MSENHNNEKSIRKKEKALKINGLIVTERGLSKPFNQYDINGNFIKKYNSSKEFLSQFGGSKSHLSITLNQRKLYYRDTIILFDNDILTINDINEAKKKLIKKVELYDLNDNYINTYDSAEECSKFLNCNISEIRMCCLNRRSKSTI